MLGPCVSRLLALCLVVSPVAFVAGCGGSSSAFVPAPSDLPARIQAAAQTADNTDPSSSCGAISQNTSDTPGAADNGFYWEIGDENGVLTDPAGDSAAGSVQPPASTTTHYARDTNMLIASATKWLYASYVAEKYLNSGGALPQDDVQYLNFTSGYDNMSDNCSVAGGVTTVAECLANLNDAVVNPVANGTLSSGDVGSFYYNSGHMEHLEGMVLGGGSNTITDLADEITTAFSNHGVNMALQFGSPNLAGGGATNPGEYAKFLQGLIRSGDPLKMASLLKPTANDIYAVCTNPSDTTCASAKYSPLLGVSWHYSIGHWIEDDANGDGSYSSPGKFGFYPWVDSSKTYYGIVARYDNNDSLIVTDSPYYKSIVCGRAIRTAFMTGTVQN